MTLPSTPRRWRIPTWPTSISSPWTRTATRPAPPTGPKSCARVCPPWLPVGPCCLVSGAVSSSLLFLRWLSVQPFMGVVVVVSLCRRAHSVGGSYAVRRSGDASPTMLAHENTHPWHTGEVGWLLYKQQGGDNFAKGPLGHQKSKL